MAKPTQQTKHAKASGAPKAHYSDRGFWSKVKTSAATAGKTVLEPALTLYYAGLDKDTPRWAKTTIASALGYFILPLDVIPDLTPVFGFSDDLGILVAAVATVAVHIKAAHKRQAAKTVKEWIG